MSEKKKLQLLSVDEGSLKQLANSLAQMLEPGMVIDLSSDLGGGKTTFVKYLVAAVDGGKNHVSSPTFTVSKVYRLANFDIHHYDLYRIGDNLGLIENELSEIADEGQDILIFEWSKLLKSFRFKKVLSLEIEKVAVSSELRNITITKTEDLDNIDLEKLV